jgi:polysaccharide export outer membrane protein
MIGLGVSGAQVTPHEGRVAPATPRLEGKSAAPEKAPARAAAEKEIPSNYVLGPGDQLSVWVLAADEFQGKSYAVDETGMINLPLVGRMPAAGFVLQKFEADLATRLEKFIRTPQVIATIAEFRSQPVSVIGAVNNPGIYQLHGSKTLVEVLSLAGGLRGDAGSTVKITRRREWGAIPLSTSTEASGEFTVAEVSLKTMMEAGSPSENIIIKPNDVVSIPVAKMVFVIGTVERPGGFLLNERETLSVLEALSMAGGVARAAAPQNSRILRPILGGPKRAEIALDVKKILAGQAGDVPLLPNDILFIPGSTSKGAAFRMIEALIQSGTYLGIARGIQ